MLTINFCFKKGVLIVKLNGSINYDSYRSAFRDVYSIVLDNGIKYLLLDFTNVLYVDKYGVKIITDIYNIISNNKGKLFIMGFSKKLNFNNNILNNLYQVYDEDSVFEMVML